MSSLPGLLTPLPFVAWILIVKVGVLVRNFNNTWPAGIETLRVPFSCKGGETQRDIKHYIASLCDRDVWISNGAGRVLHDEIQDTPYERPYIFQVQTERASGYTFHLGGCISSVTFRTTIALMHLRIAIRQLSDIALRNSLWALFSRRSLPRAYHRMSRQPEYEPVTYLTRVEVERVHFDTLLIQELMQQRAPLSLPICGDDLPLHVDDNTPRWDRIHVPPTALAYNLHLDTDRFGNMEPFRLLRILSSVKTMDNEAKIRSPEAPEWQRWEWTEWPTEIEGPRYCQCDFLVPRRGITEEFVLRIIEDCHLMARYSRKIQSPMCMQDPATYEHFCIRDVYKNMISMGVDFTIEEVEEAVHRICDERRAFHGFARSIDRSEAREIRRRYINYAWAG